MVGVLPSEEDNKVKIKSSDQSIKVKIKSADQSIKVKVLGAYVTPKEFEEALATKQDVIEDLEEIRDNAKKGSDALDMYTADKPNLALKSELPTKVSDLENDVPYAEESEINRIDNQLEVAFETIESDKAELKGDIENLAGDIETLNNTKANKSDLDLTNDNLDALTGEVENLAGEIDNKQDKLVAGTNIKIENNVISASGGLSEVNWGAIKGDIENQSDLIEALESKQDTIEDINNIRNNANAGKNASDTVSGYGDVVTHNANEFATKTELNDKQNITDNNLVTTDKTVVGAVNELLAKIKEMELYKTPNVLIQGEPTINNGQVTNLSKTNYLILPFQFDPKERGFELTYCFRTGADVTTPQNLYGSKFSIASYVQNGKLTIRVSSNGTSWNVLDLVTSLDVQPNTTYYIKLIFNRLNYTIKASTDGVEYSQIGYVVNTGVPFAGDVYIGIGNNQNNPFLGMINLHKWELKYNNNVFWEGMDDAGLATRADTSLSNLDKEGQAKFDAKQDAISDLDTIRDGASKGATAIQQAQLESYHDKTKQNKLTAGENITIVNDVISSTGGGGGGEADTSSNLVLMPNLVVPSLSGGLCTSKDYFNFGNACIINIISKFTYVSNVYNSGRLFRLERDTNNFFTVTIEGYALKIQLKLNGNFIYNLSYSSDTDEYKILARAYDYVITLDYPNRKLRIRTRTSAKVYETSLELDISEWDLDSLGDFKIVTELGGGYTVTTASKFIVLNEYINYNTYLGEELIADNFSPFSPTAVSTECVTDEFRMVVSGTRIETISPYYVKNSFNVASLNYFAMGHYSSKLTRNGNTMITKIRFSEVTEEIAITKGSSSAVKNLVVYDEGYNLIWNGTGTFHPETDKWYIMQISDGSQPPSYIAQYAYNLKGAGNVEVKAVANCFSAKNNIGSINWNGKYFTGYVPFIGEKINFVTTNYFPIRVPLYQKKIEGGKLYMYDGSVWKQISS